IFTFLVRVNDHKKRYSYQRENKPPKAQQRQILTHLMDLSSCEIYPAKKLRIPTIATTHSDGSRPAVPIDRDHCGAMTGIAGCSARAAIGHDPAAPPSVAKNFRRLMYLPMWPSGSGSFIPMRDSTP